MIIRQAYVIVIIGFQHSFKAQNLDGWLYRFYIRSEICLLICTRSFSPRKRCCIEDCSVNLDIFFFCILNSGCSFIIASYLTSWLFLCCVYYTEAHLMNVQMYCLLYSNILLIVAVFGFIFQFFGCQCCGHRQQNRAGNGKCVDFFSC